LQLSLSRLPCPLVVRCTLFGLGYLAPRRPSERSQDPLELSYSFTHRGLAPFDRFLVFSPEVKLSRPYPVVSANHNILGFVGASTATPCDDLKQPDKQKLSSLALMLTQQYYMMFYVSCQA
jgi:hypothetical protein